MASTSQQNKDNKASHKTVLKWEKEFNTTFDCDLQGKGVVGLRCTLRARSKTLAITIFTQVLTHCLSHKETTKLQTKNKSGAIP